MIVVVTGPMGSGKTTVLTMLRAAGVRVIRADDVVHDLLREESVRRRLRAVFGRRIFQGAYVSRKKLGRLVFTDLDRLKKLEVILYPLLTQRMRRQIMACKRHSPDQCLVVEAPLFHRAGWQRWFDAVLYVDAPRRLRLKRCLQRGMAAEDFKARERCQKDIPLLKQKANWIVVNRRSVEALAVSIHKILKQCVAQKHRRQS